MFVRLAGWMALLAHSSASKDAELLVCAGTGPAQRGWGTFPGTCRIACWEVGVSNSARMRGGQDERETTAAAVEPVAAAS